MASKHSKSNDKYTNGKWPKRGKRPPSTGREREAYALEQWMADPDITINGKTGMVNRLMEVFGITVRDSQLVVLRKQAHEVRDALDERDRLARESKKFSNTVLKSVPDLAPPANRKVVTPAPPPVTVPVVKAPGAGFSRRDAEVRYSFAGDYLRSNPNAHAVDIHAAVLEEFGIGIGTNAIGDLKRELGLGQTQRRANEVRHRKSASHYTRVALAPTPTLAPAPAPTTTPTITPKEETPTMTNAPTPEESIKAALQLLLAELPLLRSLNVTIDDNGRPKSVEFEVAVASVRKGTVQL